MLNLHSSNLLMLTRRLISADRDWKVAYDIFKQNHKVNVSERVDIPVIPRAILRQRLILQKALILREYNNTDQAIFMLKAVFKIGKVYDPSVHKTALKNLLQLYQRASVIKHADQRMIKKYEDMMKLYKNDKNKNIIFCIDALKDQHFEARKTIGSQIFDMLQNEDRVSLIRVSGKADVIYSFARKNKNTTQLLNQIRCLEPAGDDKLVFYKSIGECIKEFNTKYYNWIVYIISNIDINNLKAKEMYARHLRSKSYGIIFITLGIECRKTLKQLKSVFKPNDRSRGYYDEYSKQDFMLLKDPKEDRIKEMIKSISNIETMNENLIYERFE